MFKYSDGTEVMVGDSVEFDGTPGVVEYFVNSEQEMKDTGVTDPGIMFTSSTMGRFYLPQWAIEADPLELVARAPQSK